MGRSARMVSAAAFHGSNSAYTRASRTRRQIKRLYCEPKSSTTMVSRSGCSDGVPIFDCSLSTWSNGAWEACGPHPRPPDSGPPIVPPLHRGT